MERDVHSAAPDRVRRTTSAVRAPDRLAVAAAVPAAAAASAGLLQGPSGAAVPFVTARGETVSLAGSGLYRFDTVFAAAGNTATDRLPRHSPHRRAIPPGAPTDP